MALHIVATFGALSSNSRLCRLEVNCASAVQAAANTLAQTCNAQLPFEPALAAVQQELAIVLQSLQQLPHIETLQPQMSSAVPEVIRPLLQQLQSLIVDNDTAAMDVAEQLEPLLAGPRCQQVLGELYKQINNYDFDEAAVVLITLQHQFELQDEASSS